MATIIAQLSWVFFISVFSSVIRASCRWNEFNLNELSHNVIFCPFASSGWTMEYTACSNNLYCDSTLPNRTGDAMVTQDENDGCVVNLAYWDSGKIGPERVFNNDTKEIEYIFKYENGWFAENNCGAGRHLTLTFICDPEAIPFDEDTLLCDQINSQVPNLCVYYLKIRTYLACKEPQELSDDSVSAGTIITILFAVLICLYCCIGMGVSYFRHKNCRIPHGSFWKHLPRLIAMGCIVSCERIRGKEYVGQDTDSMANNLM